MATITLDPVTRIEGHLKISVTVDSNNVVTAAQATGNMFRGFENMLVGRKAEDASILTQRICGVCPVPHGVASAKAVESAAGFTPNLQAFLVRNLVLGSNFLASHILHFYHLAIMDFIKGPGMNPWTPGYSSDFRFSNAKNQALLDNYAAALGIRRKATEMQAIIGGMYPFVSNIAPGGVKGGLDNTDLSNFKRFLDEVQSFIINVYQHDANLLAETYDDYYSIGRGYANLLSFGVFDTSTSGGLLFPAGSVANAGTSVTPLATADIREFVGHSWYSSGSGENPASGTTTPNYGKTNAYSWLKSPRYGNAAYEAGPLARVWMSGDYRRGVSVMDRQMARCVEAIKIASSMQTWLSQVTNGSGRYTAVNPVSGSGIGLTEAPRGALGHWVTVANSQISSYQIITPTCWNASPMDDSGNPGPIENALVGTKIADMNEPIELLRIVHSFDPCTSCAVHVISPKGTEMSGFVVTPGI
jgi:hydrogenase large subunit